MRISRAIGFQTLATSIMFLLLVATVTFYWVRIDSAQAKIRDDALSLRDYRLLSEVVNSWMLSNELIFNSGQTFLLNNSLRQGEQIYNLAQDLSREPLAQAFQNPLFELTKLLEENQNNLVRAQQGEAEQLQELRETWDASSQEIVSRVVNLGELLIAASQENGRIAEKERKIFIALVSIECLIFSLLILMLWRWVTRQIVQPLSYLTEAAKQALQDGATMTVQKSRITEIDTLSESINEFTQSLAQRVEERTVQLKEQKQHLVKEVELRKAAEKVAQTAAAKATAANEAKGQFMANMSHELRTPLNGIIGSTQLLAIMSLDEKAQSWINTIEDSGNHLLSLVNAVLDFSDIDAGKFDLSTDIFHTDTMLREYRSMFVAQTVRKDIDLFFDIDPELPKQLIGDSLRIQQILSNLLENAIKFTESGSITVRANIVEIRDFSIRLKWEITDTGIGIPQDRFEDIFDAFEQIDGGDTRKYGGSGLGLSISRELARIMGGDITVQSKVGVGSTFHCQIELELAQADHSQEVSYDTVKIGLL